MKKLLCVIISICLLSCKLDKGDSYFQSVSENDIKLSSPMPGEWLSTNSEKGQSLEQFIASKPIKPNANKKTIYIQSIGGLTPKQQKQLELTKEYLGIFFQLPLKVLDSIQNKAIPKTARRIGYDGNEQLLASYIIDSLLVKSKPKSALVFMGFSKFDLYPKPEWNYVFGLSS